MSKAVVKKVSDYVIVGAGSAGSVLANRLTKNGKNSVTLLEAGKSDVGRWDSWTIQMPAALTYSVADKRYNWDYHTVPQRGLNNRRLHQPRGKVLGGSSSINAMVYVRGHGKDFDRWETEGTKGWSYRNCLPYFKRAQGYIFKESNEPDNDSDNPYRGYDGPLKVTSYLKNRQNILFDVFEKSGEEAGYAVCKDLNGHRQEGFGPFDMTVDANTGKRCSAAEAYLRPALKEVSKEKLDVKTSTLVRKIIFDEDSLIGDNTPRAIGVECEDLQSGEIFEVHADKEVLVCLGAVGSPQLLMLSGIGDSEKLEKVGIKERVVHNTEVGRNLQDHLEVYLQYLCTKPVSLYPIAQWSLRYFPQRVAVGLEWFLRGTGICSSNLFETGAFIRSDAGVEHPDIQYHFIPGCVVGQLDFLPQHGFQIHVGTLRPTSRGELTLKSSDPKESPNIDPNFLSTEEDISDMRKAVRLADELVQQPVFAAYKGERFSPSPSASLGEDEVIDEWVRSSSHSAYHLSCTCAMGKVVDENGSVYGVSGLRVVDASIMPSMTSGNLNAPTIMLAEKISDHINGMNPLPESSLEYFTPDNWKSSQR
mmetsp:Transcript_10804/g.14089  ORF Transcript_10804/g.14089 Transcript_10804/m.14089 type:complete len:589 (+) Transcript_10804:197-1963(+)